MITVQFDQAEMSALAGLITWGAKHPQTGSEAIMQAARLLEKLQAAMNANGKADAPAPVFEAVAS